MKTIARLVAAVALGILALVVTSSPAQAYPYAANGTWGPYLATDPVDCRHKVFGASSLLNDVLMQIRKQKTGQYQSSDYFTLD